MGLRGPWGKREMTGRDVDGEGERETKKPICCYIKKWKTNMCGCRWVVAIQLLLLLLLLLLTLTSD